MGVKYLIKVKINVSTLDNYLLIIATFIALIVDKLANPQLALFVLIVGAVIKAVGSALIEGESLVQNLDNVALAVGAALAGVIGLIGDAELAIAVMVAAYILKAVGSAYMRGDSISQNLDNIALAVVSAMAPVFPAYGFYLLAAATLLKAMGSNGLRNIIPAVEGIIDSLPNVNAQTSSTAPAPMPQTVATST